MPVRDLVLRACAAAAGPQPHDAALRWRGLPLEGAPVVRIAHFGDCSWREMPLSHGIHTPPGYPRAIAARLAELGLATEFSSVVAHEFAHLPSGAAELDVHLKLTGEPDVVLVQLGALYSRVVVLEDRPELLRLRERIARSLGRRVFLAYRLLRPLQRRFGRFAVPYAGADGAGAFLAAVRERWPGARVALVLPFPRTHRASAAQPQIERRVRADLAVVAAGAGVEAIDLAPLLPAAAPALRCANGYNLNARGSALAGQRLAAWIAEGVSSPAAA